MHQSFILFHQQSFILFYLQAGLKYPLTMYLTTILIGIVGSILLWVRNISKYIKCLLCTGSGEEKNMFYLWNALLQISTQTEKIQSSIGFFNISMYIERLINLNSKGLQDLEKHEQGSKTKKQLILKLFLLFLQPIPIS